MKTRYYALLLMGVLLAAVSIGNAANVEHHMYWGAAAKDEIWSEFDSSFANSLNFGWPVNDSIQLLTDKFYLIGLTLPDAMLPTQQSTSRYIISGLWSARVAVESVAGCLGYMLGVLPIYVDSMANVEVQTPITFNGAQPNDNFQKMWEMACYARSHNWSSYEKSLIYGAMAHCMQDIYGYAYQPSRYGYGFVLDAPEAADHKVLNYAETYSELLSGTHIPSWTFIKHLFAGILVNGSQVQSRPEALQFYSRCGVNGANYQEWQDIDFLPVQRFVEAANAVGYGTSSLTQERLESYLQGWAISLFMLYGYNFDGSTPINVGGIVAHPQWSPQRIIEFWYDIAMQNWQFGPFVEALSDEVQFFRNFPIIGQEIDATLAGLYGKLHEYTELDLLDDPWPSYLADTTGLAEFYAALPEFLKTDSVQHEYEDWYATLKMWQDNAQVLVPQDYQSYSGEVPATLSMSSLEGHTMGVGPSDVSVEGVDVAATARKAGLTGGMFSLPDTTTVRQPGVLDCGFWFRGNRVWAPIHPYAQGDPQMASVAYDLMCFDDTRVNVEANADGQRSQLNHNFVVLNSPQRWQDSVTFDLTQFGQAAACTLWFTIQNSYSSSYWRTMLVSNYDSVYDECPEIYNNSLYQQLYRGGVATRSEPENPFTMPDSFWPYALLVDPVAGYYLSTPTGLTATLSNSGRLAVELDWNDNSSYEYGYKIEKTVNGSSPTYIPASGLLDSNTTHYEDVNVAFGDTYRYRVWCERDQWESDTTSYAEIVVAVVSDSLPPTAYNNQTKVAVRGDEVHLTYYTNSQGLMYVHSSDRGKTWDAPENASGGILPATDASPAIALDASGTPYILFHHAWEDEGGGFGYRLRYYLTWPSGQGPWNFATAFMFHGDLNLNHQPDVEPPVVSFCIRGDSGFAALDYPGCDSVVPETAGTYFVTFCVSPQKTCGALQCIAPHSPTNQPVMLVDSGARRVVISTYGANEDDDSIIRVSYKEYDDSTFSYCEQDSGHVTSLSAALEDSANVLLTWEDQGGNLVFGRFARGASSYTASPGVEVVSTDGIDATLTKPSFVTNSLNLPMLVYEYGAFSKQGIWYALRLQPDNWLLDTVFVPNCYTCYPQGFCDGRNLRVLVSGSEDGNQPPYYLLSGSVALPWYQFPPTSNSLATWPNSGRKLVVSPDGENAHVVYDAGGSVKYAASQDGGETWPDTAQIDYGNYPSITLHANDMPTVVYNRDNSVFYKMRRADGTWRDGSVYLGGLSEVVGQPAVGQYQGATVSYPYCAFPVFDIGTAISRVWLVKLDTLNGFQTRLVAATSPGSTDSFVSIACVPGGPVQVAWEQSGAVMCASVPDGGMPTVQQVSQQPASHPFVETYGDRIYVAWRDLQSGCIVMRVKSIGGMWEQVVATGAGDYPACSKCGAAVFEQPDSLFADDIWADVSGVPYNLSESPNAGSEYPSLDAGVGLYDTMTVVDTLYSVWTEGVGASLYGVRFRKLGLSMLGGGAMRPTPPSNSLICGSEAVPAYCAARSSCDSSAGVRFDCGEDSLSYLIRYIDPRYNYMAEFTVASEQRLPSEQSVRVQGEEIARLQFGPGRSNTARLVVPRQFYENGTTLPITMRRLTGERVTLAGLKLFAFSPRRGQPDGVTAEATPIVLEPRLYHAAPNPSRGRTVLRYQVPRPMHVTLKIYDATGRTVRTVLDSQRPAGVYALTWDGRDERGRLSPNGIYFCAMRAGDYRGGQKVVISR